jgi:hypothetical protein
MAHDLEALLGQAGVVLTRDLARTVDRHSIDAWVKARRLLRSPESDPVHVSIRPGRRVLRRPGLVVHRVQDLLPDRVGPYPVTDLARALVDTWGLAAGRHGGRRLVEVARGAVIAVLRDRRVRPTHWSPRPTAVRLFPAGRSCFD